MHTLGLRSFRVVEVVAIGICAALLGHAASMGIDRELILRFPGAPPARAVPGSAPAPGQADPAGAVRIISDRNVFCSTCPPPSATTAVEDSWAAPQRTTLPLDLLAVNLLVARGRPGQAAAALRDRESRATGAFAAGDPVLGARVTRIEETRVFLEHAGREEWLDLLETDDGRPAAPPIAGPAAAPAPAADALTQELDRGIRRLSERSYEVQRPTLEALLGNVNLLARSGAVMPEVRDGRPAGLRLHRLSPTGPYAKLGLQNGDVIRSLNGLDLGSAEKGLEAYTKLRSAGHLTLALERGGKPTVIEYSVR